MSGQADVQPVLGLVRLNLQGPGFSFVGGAEGFQTPLAFCLPCESTTVNLGGQFVAPFAWAGGSGVIDGVSYPELYADFRSGLFTTPSTDLTHEATTIAQVPFRFTATMDFFLESPLVRETSDPIFSRQLIGIGTASALFIWSEPDRFYSISSDDFWYDFAPIPEPGTILLVGGALGGAALRRWRAGGRSTPPQRPAA